MKKALIILATLTSVTAFAETSQVNNQPMMKFGVYDVSNTVAKEVSGNKYSISNKHHRLCWTAFNMPFQPSNQVVEVFTSPKNAKFSGAVSSKDGKTHTIKLHTASSNNEFLERCWRFEKTDPKGKYSLSVSVNDVTFPTVPFSVVK